MKQVIQSYRTGEVAVKEVAVPVCGESRILVRNINSIISIGTERSIINLGRKSLIGKGIARPDLVRRALSKAKKEGLLKTWQEAIGRLDSPTPLGYSSAGVVVECGSAATEFSPGDRVGCIGQGFASHAEFISIPLNMACRIPDAISEEEAAYGMLGVIALHGVRMASLTFGSRVAVVGLGLLGLIAAQILKAYGCEVFAIDPDIGKVDVAIRMGINSSTTDEAILLDSIWAATNGVGLDAVIITAASITSRPINFAIELCRQRGRVVLVGTADIHPDRNELWHKEVEIVVSKAGGPGSLDPLYEIEGIDLPIGEVRWTLKRNLHEFYRLIAQGMVNVKILTTHKFSIHDAGEVYGKLMSGDLNSPIGVMLEYPHENIIRRVLPIIGSKLSSRSAVDKIQVGVIGAGLFGKALLLPELGKLEGVYLHTLVTSLGSTVEHEARKFGFANQSTDTSHIWKSNDINAVIGLTPHRTHAQLVYDSIKHEKSLFLEKPLCVSPDELVEIEAQFTNAVHPPVIVIGHNRRFSSHTSKIQNWLAARNSPLVIQMRINAGFLASSHWVHSKAEGRSRVVGEMSHFVDLLLSFTGSMVRRVHAERVSGDQEIVNNDNIAITLKFLDGSVGSIVYTALGDKAYSREWLEIFFDKKTITCQDFRVSALYKEGKREIHKTRSQDMGYGAELTHFFKCVSGVESMKVSPELMFHTMGVIFAIERSLSLGLPVDMGY